MWDAGSSTQWRQQEQCQKTGIADSILFSKYIHYVRIDSAVEVLEKSMLQCLTAKRDCAVGTGPSLEVAAAVA